MMTRTLSPTVQKEYFPAVDGLRTLAVMLVVIFHAESSWLPGGFIGVDIFFVISGFLITRNIVSEIGSGEWSFSNFYLRRVARLFPALYVTVLVTLLAGFFYANPPQLERLGHVSLFTILSVSNIFFWLESGYFDVSASTKPLLHTWSLAVEEQFYLVWPVLIVLLAKVRSRAGLFIGLAVIAILSLAGALYYEGYDPSAVFYLTPFRAYQFALGGMLGLVAFWNWNRVALWIMMIAGVGGAVTLAFLVDANSPHIMSATLPALAATIAIAASKTAAMNATIGSKPMVWFGRRSYSIYLAHWPLIVFWKQEVGGDYGVDDSLALILLSLILGIVLHWLVEGRFRFRNGFSALKRGRILTVIILAGGAALVTGAHYWANDGYPGRYGESVTEIAYADGEWGRRQRDVRQGQCNMTGDWRVESFDEDACLAISQEKPTWLLVGDSFGSSAYMVFKRAYPDVQFAQVTIPGCPFKVARRIKLPRLAECKELYRRVIDDYARRDGLDGLILASNWKRGHYYYIDDVLYDLGQVDLPIVVVSQQIRFAQSVPDIVFAADNPAEATADANALLDPEPIRISREMRNRYPADRVDYVDLVSLQCPDSGPCDVIDEERGVLFLDDSHISIGGAEILAERLQNAYPRLLSSHGER